MLKRPFPREVWTQSMMKLQELGAKTVAFDVFSEPALSCPGESPDQDLANSFAAFQSKEGMKVILPYALPASEDDIMKEIPDTMYNYIMDTQQAQGVNLRETRIGKKCSLFPYLRKKKLDLLPLHPTLTLMGFSDITLSHQCGRVLLPRLCLDGLPDVHR